MPVSCVRPWDITTDPKTADERKQFILAKKNSCQSSSIGPYPDGSKQLCVEECHTEGPGRQKTLSAAAARLHQSFKKKQLRDSLTKRLMEARERLSKNKRKAKRTGRLPSKKKRPSSKTGCAKTPREGCHSPCKWVQGPRRSFCRAGTNRIRNEQGHLVRRTPKGKTGCPANSRQDCKLPSCKWAQGPQRSFCRKA